MVDSKEEIATVFNFQRPNTLGGRSMGAGRS
jgi:hypothetical protein